MENVILFSFRVCCFLTRTTEIAMKRERDTTTTFPSSSNNSSAANHYDPSQTEEFEWEYGVELPQEFATTLVPTARERRESGAYSERGQEYRAKTPQMNYSQFTQVGAQYHDSKQRQYRIAMNSNSTRATLVARGVIRTKHVYRPSYYMNLGLLQSELDGIDLGTQMLHIKIPIALRGRERFPQQRTRLTLYQKRSQTTLTCRIRSVFFEANAATGYAIVDKTVMWGKVINPDFYASFITKPTPRNKFRRGVRPGLKKQRR